MKRKRKTPQERIDELERKQRVLNARIQREKATVRAAERREDTRRKIVAGAIVLEHASRNAQFADYLHTLLERAVTRPQDRALFGFGALEANESESADSQDADADTPKAFSGAARPPRQAPEAS